MRINHLSWIFKSFSHASVTATTDATAANKTLILKSFSRNTRGSLALLNDCCHRAGAVGVSQVFPRPPPVKAVASASAVAVAVASEVVVASHIDLKIQLCV